MRKGLVTGADFETKVTLATCGTVSCASAGSDATKVSAAVAYPLQRQELFGTSWELSTMRIRSLLIVAGMAAAAFLPALSAQTELALRAGDGLQWYKGNTHCHTLWSDGDMAPELLVGWYKHHGYDFLCLSDHNIMNDGSAERYMPIHADTYVTAERVAEIKASFGDKWVEEKVINGRTYMKLKALPELKAHFESPGEFVLIPGEEITGFVPGLHLNALNTRELIWPGHEVPVVQAIQMAVDQVAAQSERYGVPMLVHLNHPNFDAGVRAEDIASVREERFFEVYNGHPAVYNAGREEQQRVSCDRLWDIALTLRLDAGPGAVLYGLATDDTHEHYEWKPGNSNAGRGWIMVLARELETSTLIEAMQDGHFYATTGVLLGEVAYNAEQYEVRIQEEAGVTYTTRFIGTRKGFDRTATPRADAEGKELTNVTAKYSEDIGEVLLETTDNPAVYRFQGDELYVRAHIVSSKLKENVPLEGEKEQAWTQPALR